MKKKYLTAGCLGLITLLFQSAPVRAAAPKGGGKSLLNHLPAMFQPNLGQAPRNLQYTAAGFGYSIGFSPTRANLVLAGRSGQRPTSVGLRFVGANPESIAIPSGKAGFQSSYFVGETSLTGIPNYEKLRYASVWPGVDIVYYAQDQELEYDFVVAPKADPGAIRFRFEGTHISRSKDGELELETSAGQLIQRRAIAYQTVAGKRVEVAADYRLHADGSIGLELGRYDSSQPLVIDPLVVFQVAQFLNLAIDANVVTDLTGLYTYAASTTVMQQVTTNTFHSLVLLVAIDNRGNIAANSQIGANDGDSVATGVDLDASDNLYVTGYTSSLSGLTRTGNPLQTVSGGGLDSFLTKLSSNLASVLYGTYLGGNGDEKNCKVAASKTSTGVAYVVGQTNSTGWPTASTPAGTNGFLYAINTTQVGAAGKVWALTLGGSGTDIATGVTTDAAGNVYVAGSTTSTDFAPITSTGYLTTKGTANNDGFAVKFNSGGSLLWSTFYLNAPANAIAQFANQFAYVTGQTNGAIALTATAYQGSVGANHAYFAKFDTAASGSGALDYATYLAGSSADAGTAITAAPNGRAYIGGATTSSNFPILGLPAVSQFNPTHRNGFLSYIDPTKSGSASLVYSTYLSTTVDSTVTSVSASQANDASVGLTGYDASGNEAAGFAYKVSVNPPGDFDANGTTDLTWQNDVSRSVGTWYLNGAESTNLSFVDFQAPGSYPGWTLVGVADMDGNGIPDLIWQNDSTRQVGVWYMAGPHGTVLLGTAYPAPGTYPGWTVVSVHDMNGDGVPDLVWQNDSTRAVGVWYLSGPQATSVLSIVMIAPGNYPGWTLVGIADMDRNGVPDLVWQNDSTRAVGVWYMSNATTLLTVAYPAPGSYPGWKVIGISDMDGNGVPDLIWQNDSTRAVGTWFLGGPQATSLLSVAMIAPGNYPNWRAIAPK